MWYEAGISIFMMSVGLVGIPMALSGLQYIYFSGERRVVSIVFAFNNFVTNVEGIDNSAITTISEQVNYGIGLYIQLPFFDIFNTNNQTKRAKVQVAQAQSLVEDQQLIIRELVIRQYEDLQLKFELLKIHSTNYGNAKVNMEMVEKEFRNGQVIVYEYVRLGDITARIQTDYEKAKSDFLLAKQVLENTSGISIQ